MRSAKVADDPSRPGRGLTVRDVMTTRVVTTSPDDSVADAAAAMIRRKVGSALIMQSGFLAGILTERDVLRAAGSGNDLTHSPVSAWMTKDPEQASPDTTVEDALGGGQDEHPDRGRVPGRPVLQCAQDVPVRLGAPHGARPAQRDDHAEDARGPRDRLGGDVADVGHGGGIGPFGDVVDRDDQVGLGAVALKEEQPQGAVPPDGGIDDGADPGEYVVVGDDGDGQQLGGGLAGGGVSHSASLTRRVTVRLESTTISDK